MLALFDKQWKALEQRLKTQLLPKILLIWSKRFLPLKTTTSFIKGKKINYIQDKYKKSDLEKAHIVIATTDSPEVNQKVFADCREKNILVNVADSPSQCDFYMGSIVTKENLKIGISTNGKSQHLPSVCGNGWKTSYQNKSMIFSISYTFTARKSKGILSNKLKLLIK